MEKTSQSARLPCWMRLCLQLLLALLVVAGVRSCLGTSYFLSSDEMENSLYEGEGILVNKWSYGLRSPLLTLFPYQRWHSQTARRGEVMVFNHPTASASLPIDERTVCIARCIGAPGDTLWIDSLYQTIQSSLAPLSAHRQRYCFPTYKTRQLQRLLHQVGEDDFAPIRLSDTQSVCNLSPQAYERLAASLGKERWLHPMPPICPRATHPLIVPAKGKTLAVTPQNKLLLCSLLQLHEGKNASLRGDSLYIDGQPTTSYRFEHDYYWVASDNPFRWADSRSYGFVPHTHLIGRASLIWFSKKPHTPSWSGYRHRRFFQAID